MTDIATIIRRLSRPLEPQPTGVVPRLPKLEGIRAVVFDVYGTLIISGSGDISLTSGAGHGAAAAAALEAVGGGIVDGDALVAHQREMIARHHADSSSEFPEVDIVAVWRETLAAFDRRLGDAALERLAIEYECRVNPAWPMPGLLDTLSAIRRAGLPMGIVSNAQFFTPITLAELAGSSLPDLGFDESLCVWSYAFLQAKPGRFLYEQAARRLADRGVAAGEVLYLGNDMWNDIAPAAGGGFRTALFAGDARSLRLREGDPMVAGVEPDAVVTDLRQVLTILSLAGG